MKDTFLNVLIIAILVGAGFFLGYRAASGPDESGILDYRIDSLHQVLSSRMKDIDLQKLKIDSLEKLARELETKSFTETKYIRSLPALTTDSLARLTTLTYHKAHPGEPRPLAMASGTRLYIDRSIAIDYIGVRRANEFLHQRFEIAESIIKEYRINNQAQIEVIQNYSLINGNFEKLTLGLKSRNNLYKSAFMGTATTAILLGFNIEEGTALPAGVGVFLVSHNLYYIKKAFKFIF